MNASPSSRAAADGQRTVVLPLSKSLRRNARAAWLVLTVGLLITAEATRSMYASVERNAEQDFSLHVKELQRLLSRRLDDHARILQSGAALFQASDSVTRAEWHAFAHYLQLEKQLPGIQGMGFAMLIPRAELARHILSVRNEGYPAYTLRPEGERDVYSSIIYLEPFTNRNLRAFGYDMLSEPVRRAAMERARDTGSAALSGKVVLAQETDSDVQAGSLMYVPIYRRGLPVDTVEQRRAALQGWVYSPYRMTDLIQGILGDRALEQEKQLHLEVFDGTLASSENRLYRCHVAEFDRNWPEPRFTRLVPIAFNGHCWTLRLTQTDGGVLSVDYMRVWLALVGGFLITLLLFALLRALLNTHTREQRKAAENLQVSESNFRTFFESMTDMIIVCTPEGRIIFTNTAIPRTLGYTPDELKAKCMLDLYPADRRQDAEAIFDAMFRGERDSCPLPLASKDGKLVPVETRVWHGQWNGEHCQYGICKNLSTEQEARQRFERLFRNNPSLIALSSVPDRQFMDVNDAFVTTLGYSREEVIGHTTDDLNLFVVPELQESVERQLQTEGRISGIELQVRCKDGALLDGLFSGEVMITQGRHYLLTVMTDITALKRAEKDLTQARDAAEAAARAKSQFLANMSHEIRTPLNAILGYAQILSHTCSACETGKQGVATILKSGEHLLDLLNNILTSVRLDSQETRLEETGFDFHLLLQDVCLMLKHGTPEHPIAISATWAPAIPQFIRADKGKIRQVLFNLVGNATKFTKAGSIRLEADRLETDADGHPLALSGAQMMIAIRVQDTGCGIPDDFLPRLFEPFEQAGQHTKTSTGAGLGLTISRRIARAMGGDITAQSVEGQGSTFCFSFVAIPDDREPPATALPPAEQEPSLDESRHRVLIVDDDDDNRKMLSTMLSRAGFDTSLAASGRQALDALAEHVLFTVVLMDACMPEMDGFETIRRIRERPGMADLPILLVTGLSDADEASTAEAAHANGCVFKPFRREQLLKEIQRVTEHCRTGGAATVAQTETPNALLPPACIPHEAFRSLPAALASTFEHAVCRGDITTLRGTLAAVRSLNPLLADYLSPLIASYDYDALRRLLDPNPGDPS